MAEERLSAAEGFVAVFIWRPSIRIADAKTDR
jgi:hypothetical protein